MVGSGRAHGWAVCLLLNALGGSVLGGGMLVGSVLGVSALVSSGCAAASRNVKAEVFVESSPAGATLEIEGRTIGKTPATVEVPRQGASRVQVKKAGYEQTSFVLERNISGGWLAWDVVTCVIPITLCIPLVVDGVSGAWMNVEESYAVTLQPEAGAAKQDGQPGAAAEPSSGAGAEPLPAAAELDPR